MKYLKMKIGVGAKPEPFSAWITMAWVYYFGLKMVTYLKWNVVI